MSVTVVIKEGGLGKSLTVDKLKTNVSGGGTQLWIPEKNMTTKTITENGTYEAKDDDVPGWNRVIVNVPGGEGGSITGRDPDTGEEVVVSKDPETGEIVETVVPVEIRVIEPPTNPYGVYVDGQTITKDGMVVKAYSANGVEMQTVPIDELTINPTTAVYDQSQDTGITGEATIEDTSGLSQETINALPIGYGTQVIGGWDPYYETGMPGVGVSDAITSLTHTAAVYTFVQAAGNTKTVFACSTEPFSGVATTHSPGGNRAYPHSISSRSININGKVVYYGQVLGSGEWEFATPPTNYALSVTETAYVILYGTKNERPAGSTQTITVTWPRPGDGAILETTFDILVGPRGGSGED